VEASQAGRRFDARCRAFDMDRVYGVVVPGGVDRQPAGTSRGIEQAVTMVERRDADNDCYQEQRWDHGLEDAAQAHLRRRL
jgi:hypothetical protein